MAGWISSPLAAVSLTTITALNFFLSGFHLPLLCRRPFSHTTRFADSSFSDEAETNGFPPTDDLVSMLCSKVLNLLHRSHSLSVFLDKPRRPVQCNMLMKTIGHHGDASEALRLLRQMKNPNVQCYTTAMDALIRSDRFHEAETIFER
ncbi:hypothetical protein HPP92_011062 [Vanilla planifolia]|uniref:Pentatricopeptide repeat-containing protein n=1 Tax=Vanilla planifolia TaxID=51239 RepID=A0A835V348_VANPL|nr:hypothetical protein HPP92_011062 [Vanilla planifolia]